MLRLKIEKFDLKPDERGYSQETNLVTCLEAVIEGPNEAHTFVDILRTFFAGTVERMIP